MRQMLGSRTSQIESARHFVSKRAQLWLYILLIILSIIFTFPFVWTILTAFKAPYEIYVFPPPILPEQFRWSNFAEVWRQAPFLIFLLNTLTVAVLSIIGDITTASLVAYGFARFRFPGRNLLFLVVLSGLILPEEVTIIPQFMIYRALNWLDTLKPLILPAFLGGGAFNIFLLRQFFLTIPRDLDEAAMIDGAGSLRVLWQIILPLSKPALATVCIFSFLFHWNDFFRPLIYLNTTERFTLSLGLRFFQTAAERGGQPLEHLLMAASVMMTLPVLVLFFSLQRYFIEGITMSGIKR
ncbi:MAG: sn-glycerol-3-phosphate transport system permease protein UgpE [Patescibacteria group bacterium]|nr:MAG: sn-glycerol-3-phosphate transport system permease protein UgpE [Patescibacteria group bacterium]